MRAFLKTKKKQAFAVSVWLTFSTASPEVKASGGETFGKAGQLATGVGTGLGLRHQSSKSPDGETRTANIFALGAEVDYFVVPSLSLGAGVTYLRASTDDTTQSGWSVGPRLGYNVGISQALSFWPKVGVQYFSGSVEFGSDFILGEAELKKLTFQLDAPLVIHMAPHFFIAAGPKLDLDLSSKLSSEGQEIDGSKNTSIGLKATIGGYF